MIQHSYWCFCLFLLNNLSITWTLDISLWKCCQICANQHNSIMVGFCQMWTKIITIKRTKDLNYFSLCALDLFNTRVSQFELNYWNKWTFPRHSNLLRCTCTCDFNPVRICHTCDFPHTTSVIIPVLIIYCQSKTTIRNVSIKST